MFSVIKIELVKFPAKQVSNSTESNRLHSISSELKCQAKAGKHDTEDGSTEAIEGPACVCASI